MRQGLFQALIAATVSIVKIEFSKITCHRRVQNSWGLGALKASQNMHRFSTSCLFSFVQSFGEFLRNRAGIPSREQEVRNITDKLSLRRQKPLLLPSCIYRNYILII